jgi:hypothetical protein
VVVESLEQSPKPYNFTQRRQIIFQHSRALMKKPLIAVLVSYLATTIFTSAFATTTPRLSPEIGDLEVVWQGQGISFTYRSGCGIDGDFLPEAYCDRDRLSIGTELKVNDLSLGSPEGKRSVQLDEMTVWVDGQKVSGRGSWQYTHRLENALEESADHRIRIAIPYEVGGWHLAIANDFKQKDLNDSKPENRYFEFILADYDSVTSDHRQEVYRVLDGVAKEKQGTHILLALVALAFILAILRKLVPASIRAFRSAKSATYQKAHQARESVSRATYDYRVNREVERLRLQEEAERRRDVERQKEALDAQLQEALENEDHEKAQGILGQLADLKRKTAPDDNDGEEDPKK